MKDNQRIPRYWIEHLDLLPHPEGGFFRESYRARDTVMQAALPDRFRGPRSFCTSIYYLLESGDFSAFHRICSDETWHFYAGDTLLLEILEGGSHCQVKLGARIDKGEVLQTTVPAGAWFAARPSAASTYSLCGCTVSPGFDFDDFQIADRDQLLTEFPEHEELIRSLTRTQKNFTDIK